MAPEADTISGLMSASAISPDRHIKRPSLPPMREHDVDEGASSSTAAWPARTLEQRRCLQLGEHLARVLLVDRTDAERDVLQHFDENAAEADHDHRPELRIPQTADDDLLPRGIISSTSQPSTFAAAIFGFAAMVSMAVSDGSRILR